MATPKLLVAILLASTAALGACSSTHTSANPTPGCPDKDEHTALAGPKVADSSSDPRVKVVNAYCPIAGSHAVGEGNMTVASLTRDFNGKKIGFCCEHCPPVWDDLSAQEKQAALDAAMASEKKNASPAKKS